MPTRKAGQQRHPKQSDDYVFLNLPYDSRFEPLFLAYIAGVSAFGLLPRAPLEIPGGGRRLDHIFDLLRGCRYSIHDLSRVQVSRAAPALPGSTCLLNSGSLWLISNPAGSIPGLSFKRSGIGYPNHPLTWTDPTFTFMKAQRTDSRRTQQRLRAIGSTAHRRPDARHLSWPERSETTHSA